MTFVVYKVPNRRSKKRKAYIGFTGQDLEVRKSQHLKAARKKSSCAFHNAIQKYGWESFEWKVLSVVETEEEAKSLEIQMIQEHNTLAPNGYNMTIGGDGGRTCVGRAKSLTHRRKLSEANSGENHPQAKLTEAQVLEIHDRVWAGERNIDLAKEFEVGSTSISYIKHQKRWKCSFGGSSNATQ